MVAPMMEISRPPFTFSACSTTARRMETNATMQVGLARSPSASTVEASETITMPPFSPMNAMNRPMPMPMARRSPTGIASMMALRSPQTTSSRMTMPSRNTTAMATRQSTPTPVAPHSV